MGNLLLAVGLCGRARHGKDDVANVLAGRFVAAGYTCFPCSVSMVIHEQALRDGIVKSEKREDCTKEEIKKLVDLGNWGRAQDEEYWLDLLATRILKENTQIAVITGLRFSSEEIWLRDIKEYAIRRVAEDVLIRITRRNSDGSKYISPDRDPNDVTETSQFLLNADYEIVAKTGQKKWLHTQAKALADHLLGGINGSGE